MFAAIYLPQFSLQAALRHEPELWLKPVALLNTQETKATICELTEAAHVAGVTPGMSPTQGLARCIDLKVKQRALEQEKVLTDILLHYSYSLAPFLEATRPGLCIVQFTTRENLEQKIAAVLDQLLELNLRAQAGLADTPDLSLMAARFARPILRVSDAKDFLDPLPLSVLLET